MKKILKNEELMVGEYYWCKQKDTIFDPTIEQVGKIQNIKYVGHGHIWAHNQNNQALNKWDMYGPLVFNPDDIKGE